MGYYRLAERLLQAKKGKPLEIAGRKATGLSPGSSFLVTFIR